MNSSIAGNIHIILIGGQQRPFVLTLEERRSFPGKTILSSCPRRVYGPTEIQKSHKNCNNKL